MGLLASAGGRPLLLAAALLLGTACLDPVETAERAGDPDGGAADAALPDASCPGCFAECTSTCPAGSACPWEDRVVAEIPGCPPSGVSVTAGPRASFCACGNAYLAEPADGGFRTERVALGCAQTALRASDAGLALLVVDSAGALRLAERGRSGWRLSTPPQIGAPAALALDGRGGAHLAGVAQGALLHLQRTDGGWAVEPAAPGPPAPGTGIALAVGADGRARLAWSAATLRLATHADAGFAEEPLPATGDPVALEVDAHGRAHLLVVGDGLRHLFAAEAGWVGETIDPRASTGALALSPEGCPRAAWYAEGLRYGERTATGWTSELASEDAVSAADEPLALDPSGHPIVASPSTALRLLRR